MNWGNVRIDQTKEQGGELRKRSVKELLPVMGEAYKDLPVQVAYKEGYNKAVELLKKEVTQTPNLEEIKKKFEQAVLELMVRSDLVSMETIIDHIRVALFGTFQATSNLATEEHDEALLREFVEFLGDFYEQVGLIDDKKSKRESVMRVINTVLKEFIASRKEKKEEKK